MGLADLILQISLQLWNTLQKHYRLFFLVSCSLLPIYDPFCNIPQKHLKASLLNGKY